MGDEDTLQEYLIPSPHCQEYYHESLASLRSPDGAHIKLLYLNARSTKNKIEEVETITALIKEVDIILVVETWLNEKTAPFANMQGYESIHNYRTAKRAGEQWSRMV